MKDIQIIWSSDSKKDLKNIHQFYSDKNIQAANMIILSITTAVESIVFAEQYQVDEILGTPYRRLIVRHCKVVYTVKKNTIIVFSVFDTRQNPNKLKK